MAWIIRSRKREKPAAPHLIMVSTRVFMIEDSETLLEDEHTLVDYSDMDIDIDDNGHGTPTTRKRKAPPHESEYESDSAGTDFKHAPESQAPQGVSTDELFDETQEQHLWIANGNDFRITDEDSEALSCKDESDAEDESLAEDDVPLAD